MAITITIRFPSGASDEQVRKDAKKAKKSNPSLALHEALDVAAVRHGATFGYKQFITEVRSQQAGPQDDQPIAYRKLQYCVKCERFATHDLGSIPKCKYHADPDIDDSDIPAHKGAIPADAACFEQTCDETPTMIYGGVCFCPGHFADATQGHRNRRNVYSVLGFED